MTESPRRTHRLEIDPPPPGATRVVEVGGIPILLCNVDGALYAVENECTHSRVPLDEGALEGCELECPYHGARYDVRDGAPLAMPAKKGLRSFPVTCAEGVTSIELA